MALIPGFHGSLFSQYENASFEHFSHAEGLHSPVTRIVQDSFGFLWLGSMDGLTRFDGSHFLTYRHHPADVHTLSNNIINDLCVDPSNRIWAATNGGLCYFDHADGMWHRIEVDFSGERIDRHRIHAIALHPNGGIWFATKTILHRMTPDGKMEQYPLPADEEIVIKCMYGDPEGRAWLGTNDGVFMFDRSTRRFLVKKIKTPFTIEQGLQATVHPILPFSGDTLLIGSWYGGVQKIIPHPDSLEAIFCPDPFETDPRKHVIKTIHKAGGHEWWVGSYGNGVSIFNQDKNTFTHHFHHHPQKRESLGNEYVHAIYVDPSGIIWIGTASGLDKLDPVTQQFTSIPVPEVTGEFSVYRLPVHILEDRQDPAWLWISVPGAGLFHYHASLQSYRLYRHDPLDPSSLPDNAVHTVYYDHQDRMWIGMRSGLCLFDPSKGKFFPAPLPDDPGIKGVHLILQDKNQQYWFGTFSDGIYQYDPAANRITPYQNQPGETHGLPDNRVFCLRADREGKIWVGMQNRGMCRLDPETGSFQYFEHDQKDPGSIPDNGVFDIYEDPAGLLWIATENGIARKYPGESRFTAYSTVDGLPNNTVYTITPDKAGNLWLATNNGLSKCYPRETRFKNYFINDGLPTNNISGAMFFTRDGTLYLGTTGMITYCHPDRMTINKQEPPVVITAFRIFDKEMPLRRNGTQLEPIRLTYRQNMITFDFAALNFRHAARNQYAYSLEGFDDKWIYCGHQQSATFTNLGGGTYTFRVKAANHDGVWNETGTMVTLIVTPPFWKTWWFYLASVLAISGMLYGLYRFRIAQFMKLQQIRTRISRDLHDDIGSTLSSINMLSSMASEVPPESQKASAIFKTISSASRQAMELMSDIVWSINPKNDRMENIIIRMRQYASEILEAAHIPFTLELDPSLEHMVLPIDKRKDFYLIFKEAINNLAKYSDARRAHIQLLQKNKMLQLTIRDDGTGFDPDIPYAGNGLKNMKARASQLSGHLDLKSMPGQGTTVTLEFPFTP